MPNRYILFIVLLGLFNNLSAQRSKDSVSALYYFNQFQKFEYEDYDLAKRYADSGLYFAKRTGIDHLLGKAHMYMGWFYQDLSQFKQSNEHFYKSLAYLKKANDHQGVADAYGNIGNSYLDMREFRKSLDYQLLSLDENDKIIHSNPSKKDLKTALTGKTYALHNIGEIYNEIGLYDKALEYERRSYELEKKHGTQDGIAISCNTIGQTYRKMGVLDSARYYFQKSIDLYESGAFSARYGYAIALHEYAVMQESGLSESQIKSMLDKSLQIRKELRDVEGEAQIYLDIADFRFDALSMDSLSKLLSWSYELISDNELNYLEEKYFKLYSRYNSKIGKFQSAYFALENYLELKAISDAKRRTHDLIAGDIKHQLETKNFNDSLLIENKFAQERATYNEKIARIQNIIYLSVIGFIVLIVTLSIIINTNRRRKRMNDLLSEKNAQINEQKELVEERNKSISDSINYAKRLQSAILPSLDRVKTIFPDYFLIYQPKDVVSGDFYWFENLNGVAYLAVADCTGHGVPGAMVSVVCSNALNRSLNEYGLKDPGQLLDKTRELIIAHFSKGGAELSDGMDIALIAIDYKSKTVLFSGANNPVWIVRNERYDQLLEMKGDKQPVGYYSHASDFTTHSFSYSSGDRLYLTTDGYPDQFGEETGKKLKYAVMKKYILDIQTSGLKEQGESLELFFNDWKGGEEQVDDVCVMGIELP